MPYCDKCGGYYPESMPHSCGVPPYYTRPGMDDPDRIKLEDAAQKLIWAKNKLLSIEQAIDTLQASIDLLNEKIP